MRVRHRAGLLLALGMLLPLGAAADAGNWERFRGPNGAGVADDKDVPLKWSDKENLLWKAPLPGRGNSSPVVWGERLFIQSASEDGKERWLFCLEAATGREVWKRSAPGVAAKTHVKNTLASSTPAVDGERVYAAFWDGKDMQLCAFSILGDLVWKQDLGGFASQHGAGLSPAVYGGRVFVNFDQDGAATLLAFDAPSGKPLWRTERKAYRACYSTPLLYERPGLPSQLIVCSTAGVTGYDPASGAEIWNCNWPPARMPLRTVSSPVITAGMVFATAGDGAGDRQMIAVRLGGKGDVTPTHLAWQNRRDFPYVPCLLARDDYLYSVNDGGFAACHVAKTGAEVWSGRLCGPVTASPVLIDGKVYVAAEDGSVYVFEAAPQFKLLAKNSIGEGVMASPAVADNRLFIRGQKHLFCIAKTGK
jgi:outer membrane protein assembly factor BamB